MRTYTINMEEGQVAEAVAFSDGQVVVRWLFGDTISRFSDLDQLRAALDERVTFDPVRPEPIGDRLREARTAAGLSQRKLSREIGVSFSTISRIEAGRNFVSNSVIEDWLDARS